MDIERVFRGASALEESTGGDLVKATPGRSVWRLPFSGRMVYVKRYRERNWREGAKYLLTPPRAQAEWRAALRLRSSGFAVATPLAVGSLRRSPLHRETFFIAEELPGDRFDCLAAEFRQEGRDLEPILQEIVRLHEALLEARILHFDLHGGNLLVRFEEGIPGVGLVDLHSIRFSRGSPGRRSRERVRAKLAHSLWLVLEEEEFGKALALLAPGETRALMRSVEGLERTRLRSRSRRCVRTSTLFVRNRRDGWTVWRRRSLDLDALLALVSQCGTRVASARLPIAGAARTVRLQHTLLPPWRRALTSWKGAQELKVRGIPGRTAWACMVRRRFGLLREVILVTEPLPRATRLDRLDDAHRSPDLLRASIEAAKHHHRFGLRAAPGELLAVPADEGWRVLRCELRTTPPDRPLEAARAAQDLEAIRAVTAPRTISRSRALRESHESRRE